LRIKENSTFLINPQACIFNFRPTKLYKNLNNQIITYFIVFAFLPLLIFSALGYFLNKDMLTRINYNNLKTLNANYAAEIHFYLDHKKSLLRVLADRLPLASAGEKSPVVIEKYLTSIPGEFITVERLAEKDINLRFSEWRQEKRIGILYYRNNDDILAGTIPDRELQNLLAGTVAEYTNQIYFIGQRLYLTAGGLIPLGDDDKRAERFSSFNRVTANHWQTYDSRSGVFTAISRVPDHDILLLTEIDAHDFYASLISFRNKIILADLFFAVLLIALAVFYSGQITRPVNQLVQSVQAMSRGDLETPIPFETNDQLQILAQEFEHLRLKLQEYYQGMEEKIEVRTNELRQAQAQIGHQEKMASLGLMAAGIAHEIGNPLTSISSMAQVIKRKTVDEKITDYANNILKNIERISRIVRELVDFSKPSPHKEVEADLNEIVNSAVSIIKYDRRSKKIDFHLDLQPDLPKTSLVPDHLLQVFLNILINAVDASEGYGAGITVRTSSVDQHVQIDIADQGCGIAQANINRIFEPFFTTKGVGKGTGLGLTVSYGLVKKLQGEIRVQSEMGKGSTFSVVLPIKREIEVDRT
jgi:signal transduction histidine kinase